MSNEDSNNNLAVENLTEGLSKMTAVSEEVPAAETGGEQPPPQKPAENGSVAGQQTHGEAPEAAAAPEAQSPAPAEASPAPPQPEAEAEVEATTPAIAEAQATTVETQTTSPTEESSPTTGASEQQTSVVGSNGGEATRCNLTLVLHEKLRMELEQRPLPPKPAPDEVQLATHTVGICGSDVKYWQCGKIGNFVLTKPMILGHETSAIVMEVGENVKSLKSGDKVAVEVGLPCSSCHLCRQGKYNLCSAMAFAATPPYDGTLTRYFNHPANFCFKLPESVTLEEGALLEPMAVAVHACQRAPIKLGDVVLVCGAGAVGLLSMLTAKAFGASHVIITDISESRLKFAKEIGASECILITRDSKPSEVAAQVRQYASSVKPGIAGVDVVLECSGAESSLHLAIQAAGVGAQIVCVGCQADTVTIPLNCAVMQEIDIKGVFRYRNCYPLAMSLVESGKINLRPLVTHRFPLEESVKAFETCFRGEGVKILIKCMDGKLNLENGTS